MRFLRENRYFCLSTAKRQAQSNRMEELFANPYFTYLILPLLIALSRVADVTIGTMRIVFVARGSKVIAPVLGFFEVFIWIMAIGQVMEHSNNVICYLAYATGFAAGNYLGLWLEERLAVGMQVVRVITRLHGEELVQSFAENGFGATLVSAKGTKGDVNLVYSIVSRKRLPKLIGLIRGVDPDIFYSVEDIRTASATGYADVPRKTLRLRRWRRGK